MYKDSYLLWAFGGLATDPNIAAVFLELTLIIPNLLLGAIGTIVSEDGSKWLLYTGQECFSYAHIIIHSRINICLSQIIIYFLFACRSSIVYVGRLTWNEMNYLTLQLTFVLCQCVVQYISSVWVLQKVAIFFSSLTSATTSLVTKNEISLFGF